MLLRRYHETKPKEVKEEITKPKEVSEKPKRKTKKKEGEE